MSVSLELDTDQSKGIWEQIEFAANQLDEKVNFHFHRSCVSVDKYGDLPTPPQYDLILGDQNHELPIPPKLKTSPHWNITNSPTSYLWEEELKHRTELQNT